ncbi:Transposon Tn10 TetD protein [Halalkalibacter krulwichiae]|uniref:Transposon Tn10 TetD protein n=1 Tax=Halalkalibacter krulwichiae TaxID=199441 RepID=A0A1X9MH89_9BACI|nr:Transposon Tn10 TetD protein [Halalkalibacter krulwichiae]
MLRKHYMTAVRDSITYVEEHLLTQLSLAEIAEQVSYSPFHFHRIFQSIVGMSLTEYIRRRRLTHAASELVLSDERVLEIALKYHFSSQEAFSRAFKQVFHISPAKYRKFTRNLFLTKEDLPLNKLIPKGWMPSGSNPNEYEIGVDTRKAHGGKASAIIRSKHESVHGFATMMQMFKARKYREKRVRFSAFVKSDQVANWAGLWMRVDGEADEILAFDNMEGRPIKGTTSWSPYEVVLDIPEEASVINIGILLAGSGTVWLDSVEFEEVDDSVSVTSGDPLLVLPDEPTNLHFELDFEGAINNEAKEEKG